MTEEEYFRKNYPDSCYGDKPLSPYWDFFQDGVEFGERQSEKRIEELEKENRLLGERCNQLLKDKGELTDQIADIKANCELAIEGRDIKIKELEDHLAEEVELHLHAEEYIKSLEQEYAELEQQIEKMKCCHNCRHFAEPYKLCCYSLGDEDYDCRGRKWEIKENVR